MERLRFLHSKKGKSNLLNLSPVMSFQRSFNPHYAIELLKIAFMLVPRVFVKNLRLTQRLIDDFLANTLGAMINARFVISIAYFGFIDHIR